MPGRIDRESPIPHEKGFPPPQASSDAFVLWTSLLMSKRSCTISRLEGLLIPISIIIHYTSMELQSTFRDACLRQFIGCRLIKVCAVRYCGKLFALNVWQILHTQIVNVDCLPYLEMNIRAAAVNSSELSPNFPLSYHGQHNQSLPVMSRTALLAWLVIKLSLDCSGILVRVLLILVLVEIKNIRVGFEFLLTNLQLSELLIFIFTDPLSNLSRVAEDLGFTSVRINCAVLEFCQQTAVYVGAWLGVSLAINRVIAVLAPQHYPATTRKKSVILFFLVPWIIALAASIPIYAMNADAIFTYKKCNGAKFQRGNSLLVFSIVGMALPLSLQSILYGAMFVKYTLNRRKWRNDQEGGPHHITIKRLAVAKGLCAMLIWYCASVLPITIFTTLFVQKWRESFQLAYWISVGLGFDYATKPVSREK